MTKVRVWLHIGIPKTGTTAFQSFCVQNIDALRQKKILYPQTGRRGVAHHELAWAVTEVGPVIDPVIYERLSEEIAASGCDDVIISSEVFFITPKLAKLKACLADYDVKVIVFLRHQLVWYPSMYQQYIKQNEYRLTTSIEDSPILTIPFEHLDYFEQMTNWAQIFGNDAVRAFPYEEKSSTSAEQGARQKSRDTISIIFKAMNVPDILSCPRPVDVGQTNLSLNMDELEVVRLSNDIDYDKDDRSRLLYSLQKTSSRRKNADIIAPVYLLSREDILRIKGGPCSLNDRLALFSDNPDAPFLEEYPELDDDDHQSVDIATTRDQLLEIGASLYLENLNYAKYKFGFDLLFANYMLYRTQTELEKPLPYVAILGDGKNTSQALNHILAPLFLGSAESLTYIAKDRKYLSLQSGAQTSSLNTALLNTGKTFADEDMIIFTQDGLLVMESDLEKLNAKAGQVNVLVYEGVKSLIIMRVLDFIDYPDVIFSNESLQHVIDKLAEKYDMIYTSGTEKKLMKLSDKVTVEDVALMAIGA